MSLLAESACSLDVVEVLVKFVQVLAASGHDAYDSLSVLLIVMQRLIDLGKFLLFHLAHGLKLRYLCWCQSALREVHACQVSQSALEALIVGDRP